MVGKRSHGKGSSDQGREHGRFDGPPHHDGKSSHHGNKPEFRHDHKPPHDAWEDKGCCQTKANSSQFSDGWGVLCSTKLLPFDKRSIALNFEFIS